MSRAIAPALVAALSLGLASPTSSAGQRRMPAIGPVHQNATIDPGRAGRRLPRSFVGFSVEYRSIHGLLAGGPDGAPPVPNRAYASLFDLIARTGHGPPTLRVGGGSSDDAWWNPLGRPRPPGIAYDISPQWVEKLRLFRDITGSPLIVGLNFAANDPKLASDWAREAMARLGPRRVRALEVGNEPDIYTLVRRAVPYANGSYFARARPYTFSEYLREAGRFISRLRSVRPRARLAGPAAGGQDAFSRGLPRFVSRFKRQLDLVTWHAYPLISCPGFARPTIPTLLGPSTSGDLPRHIAGLVGVARRAGLPLRLSESNSVQCGGLAGVSNTFAASLWMTDWLFELHAAGVDGVDVHSSNAVYGPAGALFEPGSEGRPGRWVVSVTPNYFGMLLFARANANRGRLVPVDYDVRTYFREYANVKIWATYDRKRTLRITVLNKDLRRGGAVVRLRVPKARRTGSLTRLTAPRIDSMGPGIRLAGQSFSLPLSYDGRLTGRYHTQRLRPRRGVYTIRFSAPGAVMLTIPAVRR